jgi:hypoxanthine phosphoribosyltransferase
LEQQNAKEIRVATVYSKPGTISKPDYYEKETSHWIVFPWEGRETMRKIMEKTADKNAISQEIDKLVKAGVPKQLAEKFLKDMQ